jgi:hypothetical protein
MSSEPLTDRPAFRRALAIAIVLLLVGGAGSAYLIGSGSHPLTVREAVRRYRSQLTGPARAPATTAPAAGQTAAAPSAHPTSSPRAAATRSSAGASSSPVHPDPTPGVYVYDTSGYEETDALSGQRHDYPSKTTYTTRRDGCHWISRWQPLQDRWDETEACKTAKGITLKRYSMYHEFFRRGAREDFACGTDAIVMPWRQRSGDHWSFQCRSSRTTLTMAVSVVGFDTLSVGGRDVRAVHILYDATATGSDQGTYRQERWLEPRTGLFLRITAEARMSVATPLGRANYREDYRIDLTSIKPES